MYIILVSARAYSFVCFVAFLTFWYKTGDFVYFHEHYTFLAFIWVLAAVFSLAIRFSGGLHEYDENDTEGLH